MIQRILFVTHTPEFGGAEKHLLELIRQTDHSVRCDILCYGEDFYSQALHERANVGVFRESAGRPATLWGYLATFLRHRSQEVVFVKGIADIYPWVAYLAAYLSGARRVVVIEQLIGDAAPPPLDGDGPMAMIRHLMGWRTRYMLGKWMEGRLVDATICVSEAIRRRLVEEYRYSPDKTLTIHNGVDCKYFDSAIADLPLLRERLLIKPNEVVIVCVARLSHVKRIDLLLDSLSRLSVEHGAWRCIVVGGGPLESDLRARAARLGLSCSIVFTGQVGDVRPYLKMADLFVLPSDKEGFPHALLEAMVCGLPSIATDVGGNSEAMVDGRTGFLVKPGDPQELARLIGYLLVHRDERLRMGAAAKARVHEYFDVEKTMTQIKEVLRAS